MTSKVEEAGIEYIKGLDIHPDYVFELNAIYADGSGKKVTFKRIWEAAAEFVLMKAKELADNPENFGLVEDLEQLFENINNKD